MNKVTDITESLLRYDLNELPEKAKQRGIKEYLENRRHKHILDRDDLIASECRENECWETDKGISRHYRETGGGLRYNSLVGTFSVSQGFVCRLRNCELIGKEPIFVDSDGKFILECAKDNINILSKRLNNIGVIKTGKYRLSGANEILDCVFPLIRYSHQPSYYHWWMEELATLRRLDHYENKTQKEPTLLIESNPPSWITESIDLLGFGDHDVVEYGLPHAFCKELIVSSVNHHVPNDYRPNYRDYNWMRERVVSTLGDPSTTSSKRIYISREHAQERTVANKTEVMNILQPLGFESVILENLSVHEQARLFNNADIIVGPHGAGFTNILFAGDTTIVEFITESRALPFFRNLSQEIGIEYDCIPSNLEDGSIHVPISKLEDLISVHVE